MNLCTLFWEAETLLDMVAEYFAYEDPVQG